MSRNILQQVNGFFRLTFYLSTDLWSCFHIFIWMLSIRVTLYVCIVDYQNYEIFCTALLLFLSRSIVVGILISSFPIKTSCSEQRCFSLNMNAGVGRVQSLWQPPYIIMGQFPRLILSEAYFHHNMTFSLILKRNQAPIQQRSKYKHWKLSHDDIWWLPQVAQPFKTLSTPFPPSQRHISTKI